MGNQLAVQIYSMNYVSSIKFKSLKSNRNYQLI